MGRTAEASIGAVGRDNLRTAKLHIVKSWTFLFGEILSGRKLHDIRIMDRDFQVGDRLLLCEYDWGAKRFTGRQCLSDITYITSAKHHGGVACAFSGSCLHPDFGVLSIRIVGLPNVSYPYRTSDGFELAERNDAVEAITNQIAAHWQNEKLAALKRIAA